MKKTPKIYKFTKKAVKIFLVTTGILMLLPAGAYFTLNNHKVQNKLIDWLTAKASQELNAQFKVKTIDFSLFNRIHLYDVSIQDQQGDSLLSSEMISANINLLTPFKRELSLHEVLLSNADIHFHIDSAQNMNIDFLVKALKRKDTTKRRWKLTFNDIQINQSSFHLTSYFHDTSKQGIQFTDLHLPELNLQANEFEKTREPSTAFTITHLNFATRKGLRVNDLSFRMIISPQKLEFRKLEGETPRSYFACEQLKFTHHSWNDWKNGQFAHQVNFHAILNQANINTQEIGYFVPSLKNYNQDIDIAGIFDGTLDDMEGHNFHLQYGRHTQLSTDFTMRGLPNLEKTYMYHDIQKLSTSAEDLDSANLKKITGQKLNIPEELRKLGTIQYEGNFTGFINDFVTYGSIQTDLGTLSTDLSLKPGKDQTLKFKGDIGAQSFNAEPLIDMANTGKNMNLTLHVDGMLKKNNQFKVSLDGHISSIGINDYTYHDIDINGSATNTNYEGSLAVNDPNLQLKFEGNANLANYLPQFDFKLNISKADLYALHINPEDSITQASLHLTSHFTPHDSTRFQGDLNIEQATFISSQKQLKLDTIRFQGYTAHGQQHIILRSPYAEGSLRGNYNIKQIDGVLDQFLAEYLPRLSTGQTKPNGDYTMNLTLKESHPIFTFFTPNLFVANYSTIQARYNPRQDHFNMQINSDHINTQIGALYDFSIRSQSKAKQLDVHLETGNCVFTQHNSLQHLSIHSTLQNDSIKTDIRWETPDSIAGKGKINTLTTLLPSVKSKAPRFRIHFFPSTVTYKNNTWQLTESSIQLDTNDAIFISDFTITNGAQLLNVNGKIAHSPQSNIQLFAKDFRLSNLNFITQESNIRLSGTLNGTAVLANYYKQPIFTSQLSIAHFEINHKQLGDAHVSSAWNNSQNTFYFNAVSSKDHHKRFDITGKYAPRDQNLYVDGQVNNFPLNLLTPYLQNTFTDIKGKAEGRLTLHGSPTAPLLNGELALNKASFLLDYLQTRYHFSDVIRINNNTLLFDTITIYDTYGNQANVRGSIKLPQFESAILDLSIQTEKLSILNTSYSANTNFYGEGFCSGIANITGTANDISIDISAQTLANTNIAIPLRQEQKIQEKDFITFVNSDTNRSKKTTNRQENNKPQIDVSGMDLNIDLSVTQDATSKIIFESESGDMINARGEGNLKMGVNQQNQFTIHGIYEIYEGDYLFSLQNFINKKFKIKQGSTINWSGDPSDAHIDMKAVYKVKTSLQNLFYGDTSSIYQKRIPVECQIRSTGTLNDPAIDFAIEVPTLEPELQERVASILDTQEKISKQFLALLIVNNFIPPKDEMMGNGYQMASSGVGATNVGLTTTSELLSTQLSNWLSQISEEFDVGINYRPGNQTNTDEVEVALSTHLLNDRVRIRGNLDMGGEKIQRNNQNTATSNIVGDFNVDVKLNKSGKLRLKAYNKVNENLLYEEGPYTQGVGISYKEDFDRFKDLLIKYLGNKNKN